MKLKLFHVQHLILTLNTLKGGEADFAVMAIENARSGSILYNYTLIRESGMKILGEHNLRIRQNLMALPGQTINRYQGDKISSYCSCPMYDIPESVSRNNSY